MVAMPAWCPHCNKMVDGRGGIHITNSTGVKLEGNIITCPECGRFGARIVEGEFDVHDGIIDVVAATPWTRAKLAEFQSALRWAADHYERQPEEAIQRISKVDSGIAQWLSRAGRDPATVAALIGILIALAAWLFPRTPDQPTPIHIPPVQIFQFFTEQNLPRPNHHHYRQKQKGYRAQNDPHRRPLRPQRQNRHRDRAGRQVARIHSPPFLKTVVLRGSSADPRGGLIGSTTGDSAGTIRSSGVTV
jgi:hypothetical protein